MAGVFNVTPGLIDRFGPERIIDTPISELALAGAAFGAAARPARCAPSWRSCSPTSWGCALDSLVNQSSKYWYLSNEQAQRFLVVRTAVGARGARLGACHSETPTGWLLGEPGLKLVAPATVADAMALTRDAHSRRQPGGRVRAQAAVRPARASSTTRPSRLGHRPRGSASRRPRRPHSSPRWPPSRRASPPPRS